MWPMGGFWTMKWEQRLPCPALPGLVLLWDPPSFLTIPLTIRDAGDHEEDSEAPGNRRPQIRRIWSPSPCVEVFPLNTHTELLGEQENKKTKQPFYCVIPSRVWSLLELFSSSQSLSSVQLFVTPWTAACQASLAFTISQSLFKLMSIELVMPSNHLILCHPLLLLPSIFPSIRVFSDELILHIRYSKYWSFSFSISPSNE